MKCTSLIEKLQLIPADMGGVAGAETMTLDQFSSANIRWTAAQGVRRWRKTTIIPLLLDKFDIDTALEDGKFLTAETDIITHTALATLSFSHRQTEL